MRFLALDHPCQVVRLESCRFRGPEGLLGTWSLWERLAGVTGVGVRFVRELEAGKEGFQLGLALLVVAALGLTVSVARRNEIAP